MSGKPKVAFICTHNSCRSQIAEAISKKLASDVFDAYSAGTEIKGTINPDAVRVVQKIYGIDMTENQHPKLLSELPPVDIVVTLALTIQNYIFYFHKRFINRLYNRQIYGECCSFIYFTFYSNSTLAQFHNAFHKCKAQSITIRMP